jgi:CBS domain-containing protein
MVEPDDLEHSDDIESELQEIRGALFDDKIGVLGPAEAICLRETATVSEAIERMLARRHAGVLVVDADRRLIGVVTVNDVIRWLAGLFPEAVLNLPPGDAIKHPHKMDAG